VQNEFEVEIVSAQTAAEQAAQVAAETAAVAAAAAALAAAAAVDGLHDWVRLQRARYAALFFCRFFWASIHRAR